MTPEREDVTNPQVSADETEPRPRRSIGRRTWVAGIAIAALIVIVLAPLASRDPDGLERVAEDLGFIDRARNFVSGLLPNYEIPGISDPTIGAIVSGLIGIAIVVGIVLLLGRLVARRSA
jgi:cobalt/nickel transport system permease protein